MRTPDLLSVLALYVESGWVNANRVPGVVAVPGAVFVVPAYLVLASDILVRPRSEVQVTTRCYSPFRAHKMIVSEGSGRFDLVDLKVGLRSQFSRVQSVPLREHVARVGGAWHDMNPDPICWPLDLCACGSEVSARAIISDGCEEDHGANFEVVLLGETVF